VPPTWRVLELSTCVNAVRDLLLGQNEVCARLVFAVLEKNCKWSMRGYPGGSILYHSPFIICFCHTIDNLVVVRNILP